MKRIRVLLSLLLFGLLASPSSVPQRIVPAKAQAAAEGNGNGRDGYVGDAACLPCHRNESLSYIHTAHHLTSQLPDAHSILGSFRVGSNILMIADPVTAAEDPGLFFKMEAMQGDFYQTAVMGWPGQLVKRSERIDVVIGSGVRGQSYLYWHGNQLFELPVSYWLDGNQWTNSPGYKNGTADFARPIYPRCLECHATYIRPLSLDPLTNHYDRASLVIGISCEVCHGPGAAHVALNRQNRNPKVRLTDEAILNPAKFSRDRQVELCALCHNGLRQEEIGAAFTYKPGQALDSYLQALPSEVVEHPDVHGNQVGLLQRSRCYLSSPRMTCTTCHDVHAPEKTPESYSSRCLNCHQVENCGMFKTFGHKIAANCIDCHMPLEQTSKVASETAGQAIRPRMRNHWIKVYPGTEREQQ